MTILDWSDPKRIPDRSYDSHGVIFINGSAHSSLLGSDDDDAQWLNCLSRGGGSLNFRQTFKGNAGTSNVTSCARSDTIRLRPLQVDNIFDSW